MAVAVRFSGVPQPIPDSWSIEEDATSLDRSEAPSGVPLVQAGSVGEGSVLGSKGRIVVVDSADYGRTSARINDAEESDAGWTIAAGSPLSRLLQVGEVKPASRADASTAVKRFFDAVSYTDYTLEVDPLLNDERFYVPSGYEVVWAQLRQWLSANELDLTWVIDRLYLMPQRSKVLYLQDVSASYRISQEEGSMAKAVHVDIYHRTPFTQAVVYPPRAALYGGGSPMFGDDKSQVISVESGEQTTVTLNLSAEVNGIRQPRMISSIPVKDGVAAITPQTHYYGAYMVVGKDNKPIMPGQWHDMGGGLTVTLNKDRKSVEVSVTGMAFPELSPYRICESDGKTDYPGLFLVGADGAHVDIERIVFDTGVTGTDDTVDIQNPAIHTRTQAYHAAQHAADKKTGHSFDLSWTGPDPVRQGFRNQVRQAFGRIPGARFLLRGHWWRAREVSFGDTGVGITADRDPTLADLTRKFPTADKLIPGGRTLAVLSDEGILK